MHRDRSVLSTSSGFSRLAGILAVGGALGTVALNGCGSRGPLDGAPLTAEDAAVEASPADAATPVVDAGREGGGIAACGACVVTTCTPAIFACIQSPACRTVFQCVAGTCLGGAAGDGGAPGRGAPGGLNPLCLFKCAGSDPAGASDVLNVFQCITGKCGSDCTALIGGIGGAGGGLGTGGGPGGGRGKAAPDLSELFSPWPELYVPANGSGEAR